MASPRCPPPHATIERKPPASGSWTPQNAPARQRTAGGASAETAGPRPPQRPGGARACPAGGHLPQAGAHTPSAARRGPYPRRERRRGYSLPIAAAGRPDRYSGLSSAHSRVSQLGSQRPLTTRSSRPAQAPPLATWHWSPAPWRARPLTPGEIDVRRVAMATTGATEGLLPVAAGLLGTSSRSAFLSSLFPRGHVQRRPQGVPKSAAGVLSLRPGAEQPWAGVTQTAFLFCFHLIGTPWKFDLSTIC